MWKRAVVAAVDRGGLQLERGAAGAAAVAGAVDLDGAARGADEIVQDVVLQQQAAGVGHLDLAVVAEACRPRRRSSR